MKNLASVISILNRSYVFYTLLLLNLIYNLLFRYNYSIPYGYDEIITIYPVGNELIKYSLNDWGGIIFSRFLSEDHIFPVTNIFAYLICKLPGDILFKLFWSARFFYILIIYLWILLLRELNFSRNKLVLFLAVILNSDLINIGILSYNLNFNLVCVFSILSVLFYLKVDQNRKIYFSLFLISSILGTFTSENFYIVYPTILFIYFISYKKIKFNTHLFTIFLFLSILVIKFIVSNHFLGVLMPKSRLDDSNFSIISNLIIVISRVFNNIFLGLPIFAIKTHNILAFILFSILILVVFRFFIKNKRWYTKKLFLSFAILIPFIGYAGRYHLGMWTFVELLGISLLIFVIDDFLKNKQIYSLYFYIIIFITSNCLIVHSKTLEVFNNSSKLTNDVNRILGKKFSKLILFNFENFEIHPIAFWLGAKIYNGDLGLSYSFSDKSIHMYGIDIEKGKIDDIKLLKCLSNGLNKDATILYKSHNSYIKFSNNNCLTSEYIIFDEFRNRSFNNFKIFNPHVIGGLSDTLNFKIIATKKIIKNPKISVSNGIIYNVEILGNTLTFKIVTRSAILDLKLDSIDNTFSNFFVTYLRVKQNINSTNFLVKSDKKAFYKLSGTDSYEAYGSFISPSSKNLNGVVIVKPEVFNIQFWFFDVDKNKWESVYKNNVLLKPNSHVVFSDNSINVISK